MRHLIRFLVHHNYIFLFLLLEFASFVLIINFNYYQQGVYFTSCNRLVGSFYDVTGGISSYFNLREQNDSLVSSNIRLQQELTFLQQQLNKQQQDSLYRSLEQTPMFADYTLYDARVINNSVNHLNNYITLNKGAKDGIQPAMGVVNGNGIVGIVRAVSAHYSLVLSVLNSKSTISCKLKNKEFFGYLLWTGESSQEAQLCDLPTHAILQKGDTIITSGYSALFPEGMMVGVINKIDHAPDGLSYILGVKLSTDMTHLSAVRVIANNKREERIEVESKKVKE